VFDPSGGLGMSTAQQRQTLRALGKRMIDLEVRAKRFELVGDQRRADDFWDRRETVQWMRSLLLRDAWANARESSLVKQ
jgi:hypothetical protein